MKVNESPPRTICKFCKQQASCLHIVSCAFLLELQNKNNRNNPLLLTLPCKKDHFLQLSTKEPKSSPETNGNNKK